MVLPTNHINLPEESELTVREVNVSWPVLQAASFYIGKKCEYQNNEFMLCRKELKDPRKCLNEGKEVTACAIKLFQGIKKHCAEEFDQYKTCLEMSTGSMEFKHCRKTQAVFDECMLKHLNLERPSFGYFCEARVHDSPRPEPPKPVFPKPRPDASPFIPWDDEQRKAEPAQFPAGLYF